jgi:hypothetical protein
VSIGEDEVLARATPAMTKTSESSAPSRDYERFLEMPVAFLLRVMWLAGASLMGLCALVVYLAVSALT